MAKVRFLWCPHAGQGVCVYYQLVEALAACRSGAVFCAQAVLQRESSSAHIQV